MSRIPSANQCRQQLEAVVIDARLATDRGQPVTVECARGEGHAGPHRGKTADKIEWERRSGAKGAGS